VNKKDEMMRHQPYYQFPKLTKSEIDNFLKKLESVHMEMIEKAVYLKQEQGFPEANEVIKWIMEKK